MPDLPVRRAVAAVAATATALLTLGLVAVSACAAGSLPRAPTHLDASASSLRVRPSQIFYTGDGTGLLSGRKVSGHGSGIQWSSWTGQTAMGIGENQLNNCVPSCAGGHFTGYPVSIEMWRPRALDGETVFTRLTITYTAAAPKGEPAHFTFTDNLTGSRFGWGPPDTQGYCVHTHGQKPEPGCRNIHTLPPAS